MKKYKVEIEETLCRVIEVEAESKKKAIDEIMDRYMKQEIILGAEDYVETHFDVIK